MMLLRLLAAWHQPHQICRQDQVSKTMHTAQPAVVGRVQHQAKAASPHASCRLACPSRCDVQLAHEVSTWMKHLNPRYMQNQHDKNDHSGNTDFDDHAFQHRCWVWPLIDDPSPLSPGGLVCAQIQECSLIMSSVSVLQLLFLRG